MVKIHWIFKKIIEVWLIINQGNFINWIHLKGDFVISNKYFFHHFQ